MARPDLIRRADALNALQIVAAWSGKWQRRALSQAYDKLHRVAAVEAKPVVHGRWEVVQVWKDNPQTTLMCSLCKTWQPIYEHDEWKFCPFCGMPMDAQDMDVPTKDGGAE